jgi:hypothetical protein
MAVLEVQIGCYIEVIDSLWPDYIRDRSLAEDAAVTSQALTGDALDSDQWREIETLVVEFMSKARPFVERNSNHRASMKAFFDNEPRVLFPSIT